MTRIIVVGAGLMGRWHAHAAARSGAEVVGVVDPDEAKAGQLAGRAGSVGSFRSLADSLGSVEAEVVHVCTPAQTHEALIDEALDGGRHVVAEKPVTERAEATVRLLSRADRAGLTLTPVHQFPFQRGVRRLLRDRATLGRIHGLSGVVCSAGADAGTDADRDRVAADIVPHFLALTAAFAEQPIDDPAAEWHCLRSAPGEWLVTGRLDGVAISLTISMSSRPTRNEWEVRGSAGTGRADLFHGYSIIDRGGTTRRDKVLRPFRVSTASLGRAALNLGRRGLSGDRAYPGLRELLTATYRSIAEGTPAPIPPHETAAIARVSELLTLGAMS